MQDQIKALKVVLCGTGQIKNNPRNSRKHNKKQIRGVADSIKTYGWTNPIIIDEEFNILAGHARLAAARLLGLEQVPTIRLDHMTEAQKRAYVIADNRLAEVCGNWNRTMLAQEHQAILNLDPGFEISMTGFSLEDVEILIDTQIESHEPEGVEVGTVAISRIGDVWIMGEHRLICGDALDEQCYRHLLGTEQAQIVICPFPYNVPVNGHVVRRGRHREFVMASGEMSRDEFSRFLATAVAHLINFSIAGSVHFLFMDWRHLQEIVAAIKPYSEFKNLVVWNKETAGLGAFYRSQHELIFVVKNGRGRHINNFSLGQKGRYRTNVWSYPGMSGFTRDRIANLAMHPTVQPVAMITDALKDCSRRGGLVLDPFGGSGTTLMAAELTGRRARLIELDPLYVDVTVRRWQAETKSTAILESNGLTFGEIRDERLTV